MDKERIADLRKQLQCTQRELADTLGIEAMTVQAWESGIQFPTKKIVQALLSLGNEGPSAIKRRAKRSAPVRTGLEALDDPRLWSLVKRLVEHPELLERVIRLAEEYAPSE